MRLGAYPCNLVSGTIASHSYKADKVSERHRHRYEFNNDYRPAFEENGVVFSGVSPDESLVEIIELKEHPFFKQNRFFLLAFFGRCCFFLRTCSK